MDHSHMDHGDHSGHNMPGMDHGPKCNMNMLFTWDTTDLCIVFRGWHISGPGTLILSLLAIVLMTAGYEAVREASRRYDAHAKRVAEVRTSGDDLSTRYAADDDELSSLLRPGRYAGRANEQQMKVVKALLYAVQVFYSFFIMLLFMTYNGWVMLAVAVGAFVGYMLFSNSPPTKTAACH
ncbi:Ctr-domain-containing protein [Bimuria novae-zelandiae CBS 107.79]|uniref:Copper transport protein n=1 Tax=Bimuria novae-zelandiae CBS 107.79 TaxID=1447943 RepID=A0A6A5VFN3_9PLEO|nr:Ctr-domain-containing protein [Bimuria novae-zelandiae CBS 107.79]